MNILFINQLTISVVEKHHLHPKFSGEGHHAKRHLDGSSSQTTRIWAERLRAVVPRQSGCSAGQFTTVQFGCHPTKHQLCLLQCHVRDLFVCSLQTTRMWAQGIHRNYYNLVSFSFSCRIEGLDQSVASLPLHLSQGVRDSREALRKTIMRGMCDKVLFFNSINYIYFKTINLMQLVNGFILLIMKFFYSFFRILSCWCRGKFTLTRIFP